MIKLIPSVYKQHWIDERKFKKDVKKYISLCNKDERFPYRKDNEFPILNEYRSSAANLDSHYFLQDIWMARKVIQRNPDLHYDIGSRVDGFLAHLLAANIKVNMVDIRPIDVTIDGLSFTQGDAMDLSNIMEGSIPSLSSLHVIEHFGLGRYGDAIDPAGWIKGLKAMQRIVEKGGYFYLSFPTGGINKLCFNAHRVFEYHEAKKVLNEMELVETAYISDYRIIEVPIKEFENTTITDDYACGLYVFRKI